MPLIPASIKNNPKLKFLKTRFEQTIALAIEKAAAHLKAPTQYPLPSDKKTLEYALVDLVKVLPKKRQEKFLDKLKTRLNANSSQRNQRYGDLGSVDLKSKTAIVEQVKVLPVAANMKIKQEEIDEWLGKISLNKGYKTGVKATPNKKVPRQASVDTSLLFSVENITCVKNSEIGKDEITASAFVTDSLGGTLEKDAFFSDKFKKGQGKDLGAAGANLFTFILNDSTGGVFPRTFSAGVFLTEKDFLRNAGLSRKIASVCSILGITLLALSLVLLFVAGPAGPLLFLIFSITGGVIFIVGGQILPFFFDDISTVGTDDLLLNVLPNPGETFARTVSMELLNSEGLISDFIPGNYTANLRWTVV